MRKGLIAVGIGAVIVIGFAILANNNRQPQAPSEAFQDVAPPAQQEAGALIDQAQEWAAQGAQEATGMAEQVQAAATQQSQLAEQQAEAAKQRLQQAGQTLQEGAADAGGAASTAASDLE